jgi:flagellar basal-body rod protein FlgF
MPVTNATNVVDMNPGALMVSGRALDVYVNTSGAIAVQGPEGQELYTRRGDLTISADGQLMTGTGSLVLGDGGPITVPGGSNISITNDGSVNMIPQGANAEVTVGRIKLVDTKDTEMLIREDGLYQVREGALPASADITLTTKALEGSNVTVVDSMVRMITLSRQYEMSVNMIKNAREVDAASASLMRLN